MGLDVSNGGNGMVMPVGPMYGNSGLGGFGGDGAWWLLVLFLFAFNRNGFGGGYQSPVAPEVQSGFNQQAVMGGLSGITSAISTGFANAEVSRCNQQANVLQALNGISMAQQNCCCENRAAVADLKYTVANEACADRAAVSDGIRDVIANQTANTNALQQTMNQGFQGLRDYLCQQEIDALKNQVSELRSQRALSELAASQNQQTDRIVADNAQQTARLLQILNPTPIPAYTVQNPNCCNGLYPSSCGCGSVA